MCEAADIADPGQARIDADDSPSRYIIDETARACMPTC